MISSLAEVNSGNKFCIFCEMIYENIVDHCLHDCPYLDNERSEMWQVILSLSLPVAEILRLIEIFICIFNFLIISADLNIFIYAFMI